MKFKGARAIVLGGTSGIGLAVSRQLAAAGAEVIAGSRSDSNLATLGGVTGVTTRRIDVLDRNGLEALFVELAPFDILVNAATGGERAVGPFLKMDLDGFQASFRKLWGYVNSVRLGASHMSEHGAIVLVSGFPARKCPPGAIAISTVGGAVEAFARGVAPELAPIRINVVSPGTIDTPMFPLQGDARAELMKNTTGHLPIPRAGTADEVAEAIVLALANDYMTGATLDVDGGALLP
jgi:NAD(P)-dependent dehydrogenase (short-subunit alcohol dehydrogenase family)